MIHGRIHVFHHADGQDRRACIAFRQRRLDEAAASLAQMETRELPPTLIASIYGMNFVHMPELKWTYGYPLAGVLMLASALVPLWYFKRRGWL